MELESEGPGQTVIGGYSEETWPLSESDSEGPQPALLWADTRNPCPPCQKERDGTGTGYIKGGSSCLVWWELLEQEVVEVSVSRSRSHPHPHLLLECESEENCYSYENWRDC